MYETEVGNKCQQHLERLVGTEAKGRVVIWGHKDKIVIENPDTFHQIAQAIKIRDIQDLGGLFYIMDIEREDNVHEHWTVVLDNDETKFLIKYGKQYNIIK